MKRVIILCGFFILQITLSNCKKNETTPPEKCIPPSAPYSTNNGPLGIGDTLKFTTISIPGATYSWSGPNNFTSNLQNPSLVFSEKATGEYLVTATVNGCTSEAYHNYVTNTNITATSSVGTLTTKALSLHASVFYNYGFTIPATYSWKGPNGFTSTEQDPTITNVTINAAGTYSVTATAISNGKKSNEATTTVFITPIVIPVSSNSPISTPVSVGTTLNLIAPGITGATSYSWTGPNGFTSNLQNPSINNVSRAAAGTYYFYYTLNNVKSETSKTMVGIKYSNSGCNGQTSVTHNGVIYNTIEIGNQCWLKENLRNNSGTRDSLTWDEMMNTAITVENQGVCPTGWHLPNDDMLKQLAISVNGDGNQLKKIGQGMGAGTGTNTSGFSALLEIRLTPADSTSSIFWSTTQISSTPRYMQLFSDTPLIYYSTGNRARKYNVRCLKD
jgi:uncharacterized protein (TIGR02145 family)